MLHESQFDGEGASLSPAVQSLFPVGVIAAEKRDAGDATLLFPEERAYVHRAVDKRVREFAAGRACARRALGEFGLGGFILLAAADRQPVWPDTMVGSITHTGGYCLAVVAEKKRFSAIGIDSERIGQVGPDLWATIAGAAELEWCMGLPEVDRQTAMTLVFSAKEAFYKAQYPLTTEWLDFHDLRIQSSGWNTPQSTFTVHFSRPLKIEGALRETPQGRYLIHDGILTAGISVLANVQDP